MKRSIIALACTLLPIFAFAQDDVNFLRVDSEIRVDHTSELGFTGNSLNLAIEGRLAPDITFHFKHRFNKTNTLRRNFDATDWSYLDFQMDPKWRLSAGKQVVALGGMEYNSMPVDMYFSSIFWSDMPCYKFGVSTTRTLPSWKDFLTFQICKSPFGLEEKTYAYNLLLENYHGRYLGKHSISAMEYTKGQFFGILASGNEFRIGKCAIQADATLRYGEDHVDFISDYTLGGKLTYRINDELSTFAKVVYDNNGSLSDLDLVIRRDTRIHSEGLGVEFSPERFRGNVRFHAVFYHRDGVYNFSVDDSDISTDINQNVFNVGITWNFNFLNL